VAERHLDTETIKRVLGVLKEFHDQGNCSLDRILRHLRDMSKYAEQHRSHRPTIAYLKRRMRDCGVTDYESARAVCDELLREN